MPNEITQLLETLQGTAINNISLYFFEGVTSISIEELHVLCKEYIILRKIRGFKHEKAIDADFTDGFGCNIRFSAEAFEPSITINPNNFVVNMENFIEAQQHNLYLNRKLIFTDKDRIVKHHNLLHTVYTNKEAILEKLNSDEYQEICMVSKNQILVCNHCEFRYMCTDSRIPTKNKNDTWYYETECNYNPFICKWSHEEDYYTLKECGIDLDNNKGLKIDSLLLQNLFKKIWA